MECIFCYSQFLAVLGVMEFVNIFMYRITGGLILGIFGGLIVIISSVYQWYEKAKSDQEAIVAREETKAAQDSIQSLSAQILANTGELRDVYKENSALQKSMNTILTGGESVPILMVHFNTMYYGDMKCLVVSIDICNEGKDALPNLAFEVSDIFRSRQISAKRSFNYAVSIGASDFTELSKVSTHGNMGRLAAKDRKPLYTTVFELSSGVSGPQYAININWGGGYLISNFAIEKRNQKFEAVNIQINLNGNEVDHDKYLRWQNLDDLLPGEASM